MKTSIELVPNQISTFTCTGTIQKESPFSVKWYRKSLTSFSQLQDDQAKIIGQNECNRSIISLLNYNVSKTDGPNLVFSCQIQSGKNIVHKMKKFAVQGKVYFIYVCVDEWESIFEFKNQHLNLNLSYTNKKIWNFHLLSFQSDFIFILILSFPFYLCPGSR